MNNKDTAMIVENLKNELLINPLTFNINQLFILSGYATPNMTSWFMKNISLYTDKNISLNVIVGMVPYDGLSLSIHEGFKELVDSEMPRGMKDLQCSYVHQNKPVHSNVYIWARDNVPVIAFTGSANFTQASFLNSRREIMNQIDPISAMNYYLSVERDAIYCNHAEVEEHVMLYPTHPILDNDNRPTADFIGAGIENTVLSLLARDGETGRKSGINWGQRKYRNPNEAYIGLPAPIARSGFFPLEEKHFTVVTDDGHTLILRVEQQNDKAITTPLSNAQLGEYLRNRLELANGAYVHRSDLERHGRTDITFYKLDDEQFYMDFSV